MPWPTRSKRLGKTNVTQVGGVIQWFTTCPAENTWLVKDFSIFNYAASAVDVALWVRIDNVPHVFAHFPAVGAGRAVGTIQRSLVVHGGESIGFSTSVNAKCDVLVSGAQLGP